MGEENYTCAFCGGKTDRLEYSLKPPHEEYLREERNLDPPIHGYKIPACSECWDKAEALRQSWLEGIPTEDDYLDEIRLDTLVDVNLWKN